MNMVLKESEIKKLIRAKICEMWANSGQNIDKDYDEYLERHEDRRPGEVKVVQSMDIVNKIGDVVADPTNGFIDNAEARSYLIDNGINPDDEEAVKEFVVELIGGDFEDEYEIEYRDNSMEDDGGLIETVKELKRNYPEIFYDSNYMADIIYDYVNGME